MVQIVDYLGIEGARQANRSLEELAKMVVVAAVVEN